MRTYCLQLPVLLIRAIFLLVSKILHSKSYAVCIWHNTAYDVSSYGIHYISISMEITKYFRLQPASVVLIKRSALELQEPSLLIRLISIYIP